MSKPVSKILEISVVVILSLLLAASPLFAFPLGGRKAEAAPKNNSMKQEEGDSSPEGDSSLEGEVIDSETMGEDLFPGTEILTREDLLKPSDPYSKTSENPDGTFTKEIYIDPVNWENQDGNWQEIDSSLVEEEKDGYSFANASNSFKFRLSKKSGKGKSCVLDIGGKKLKLDLEGQGSGEYKGKDGKDNQEVKKGKPTTEEEAPSLGSAPQLNCVPENNQAYYYDEGKGYSLEFIVFNSAVEMLIKLESPDAPNTFNLKLDLEGLDVEKDEQGKLHFTNQDDGTELFTMSAPVMLDSNKDSSNGMSPFSSDVSMDITKDKKGKAHLTITADPAWLSDPARVYPVYIDPWVGICSLYAGQSRLNHGDAWCNSSWPDTNFDAIFDYNNPLGYYLQYGNYLDWYPIYNKAIAGADPRAYFHNILYNDPNGTIYNVSADISQAYFYIYCQSTYTYVYGSQIPNQPIPTRLSRVTTDWTENTVTWNTFPQTSYLMTANVAPGMASFDVTQIARQWVQGEENGGLKSRGFALDVDPSINGGCTIGAREDVFGFGWYGSFLSVTYKLIGCPINVDEVPTKFVAGETKACPVYLKNTGEETWQSVSTNPTNPVRLGYNITDRNGQNCQFEGSRVELPRDVKPGETVSLSVPVTAPSTPGDWRIYFKPLKEGEYWFCWKGVDNKTVDITVIDPASLPQDAERTTSSRLGVGWMSYAPMGGLSANLYTGNASASATDLSVSGRGAFALSRTYNSGAPAGQTTLFGPNWFSNLDAKVRDYGNGYLGYWDSGGTSYLLTEAVKANTFVCPEGAYFKAEKNPSYTNSGDSDDNKNWKYKVLGTGGVSQHFDENGKLLYIVDASRAGSGTGNYKNKTRISYNFDGNGNIRATDASGRTFTITCSGGKITQVAEDSSWANADGHTPRTVSYQYNGYGGRLSKITLNPGDHWSSYTYKSTSPNQIINTEAKIDTNKTEKSNYAYVGVKLASYRDPRSNSESLALSKYTTTITYNSGNTVVCSPAVSTYVPGVPANRISARYVFDAQGHTVSKYAGVNPDGSGLERVDTTWNSCHQSVSVTNYSSLNPLTVLGSTTCLYDGKGNMTKVSDDLDSGQKAVSTADYTASRPDASNPTTMISPDGDTVSASYNSGENYFQAVDKAGAQSVVLRDSSTENGKLSVTLPAPYVNLLQNSSFERDTNGDDIADGWTTEGEVDGRYYGLRDFPGPIPSGKKCFHLTVSGNTKTNASIYAWQQVTAEPNTDYTLSFNYVNSANPQMEKNCTIIREFDQNGAFIKDSYAEPWSFSEWTHYATTFKTTSNTRSITIYLRTVIISIVPSGQNATTAFDSVQLYKGTRDTAFNYVENAAFERANGSDPADWSLNPASGSHSRRVTNRYVSPGASLCLIGSQICLLEGQPVPVIVGGEAAAQAINVKKNTRYLVSGYVYFKGGGGGARFLCGNERLYYNSGKGYIDQDTEYISNIGKWVRLCKVVNTGSSDVLNINLDATQLIGTDSCAYFDDISLTELPDDVESSYDSRQNYVTQAKSPKDAGSYNTSYTKYDPIGNVLEARDARSAGPTDNTYRFSYSYNELSQVTSVVTPLVKDAQGNPMQAYTTTYNYDVGGRLRAFNDNNLQGTGFNYNDINQVTAKTDPNQRTVQMEYNEVGGIKKIVYPNGWEAYYSYRIDGKADKVAFKDPSGQVTNPYTFVCDAAGRVTSISDSQTGITLSLTYDKASRVTAGSDNYAGGFTGSYSYTKAGRITGVQYSKSAWGSNVSVNYAYRDTGEQSTLTLPGGRAIGYVYDDRGRLSTIQTLPNLSGEAQYQYDSTAFSYDATGRPALISQSFVNGGSQERYEYDEVGNITRMTRDDKENLYAYDALGRLVSWTEKTAGQVTNDYKYYYDGNGNISRVNRNGVEETCSYDNANQITNPGFTYDLNGNLTSDGAWTYAYDRGSRLVSATSDSQNLKLSFGYDPQGKRISKTAFERDAQGQYTVQKYASFYHCDTGGNVLCETDAAGNVIRSFAYDLSGHPVAFTQDLGQGPKTFYLHTNAHGDVTYISDDTMNWVKKFTYDPWGKILSETSSSSQYDALSCPYGYAGYFRDAETGLYYMPARYYSPTLRRFLVKDSHPGQRSNPLTLNPYQYCQNNPINRVDPSGQLSGGIWNANRAYAKAGRAAAAAGKAITGALKGLQAAMSAMVAAIEQMNAGIAMMNAGIKQVLSGINGMVSGMQTCLRGVSAMNAGIGSALGGIGIAAKGLAQANSSMPNLGIYTAYQAWPSLNSRWGSPPSQPQGSGWSKAWNGLCAVGGFIEHSPISNVVVGCSEMIAGGLVFRFFSIKYG